MAIPRLPQDFREFLKLLNDQSVDYLLVGSYAVGYHGYVRSTGDMNIWIRRDQSNAEKLVSVLTQFGFGVEKLSPDLFMKENNVVRLGVPPFRIELMTTLSGVKFEKCDQNKVETSVDGIKIPLINLDDLKANKKATGRHKDLDDLEHLP